MSGLLPCPMCSSVIHEGPLTRAAATGPSWHYCSMTSAKRGIDHFQWTGCGHAKPIGPADPTDVRETTDARWNVEAQRLFEQRTAAWNPEARATFARLLGFRNETPVTP